MLRRTTKVVAHAERRLAPRQTGHVAKTPLIQEPIPFPLRPIGNPQVQVTIICRQFQDWDFPNCREFETLLHAERLIGWESTA